MFQRRSKLSFLLHVLLQSWWLSPQFDAFPEREAASLGLQKPLTIGWLISSFLPNLNPDLDTKILLLKFSILPIFRFMSLGNIYTPSATLKSTFDLAYFSTFWKFAISTLLDDRLVINLFKSRQKNTLSIKSFTTIAYYR